MNNAVSTSTRLQNLTREHRGGGSLAQAFYMDPGIFELEVERFLGAHWILAGHIATSTIAVFRWLVRADASEGQDYAVEDLVWLWDETTKQDKGIIELNAVGVASRGYTPGPYSQLEGMTSDVIDRYFALMTDTA